jgi:hypothetical protein
MQAQDRPQPKAGKAPIVNLKTANLLLANGLKSNGS